MKRYKNKAVKHRLIPGPNGTQPSLDPLSYGLERLQKKNLAGSEQNTQKKSKLTVFFIFSKKLVSLVVGALGLKEQWEKEREKKKTLSTLNLFFIRNP